MRVKRIWILTSFPGYFAPLSEYGVLGSALRNERCAEDDSFEIKTVLYSDYSPKGFKGVDDAPFGGGHGMVMRADVLQRALLEGVIAAGEYQSVADLHVVFPAPRGKVWCHQEAVEFGKKLDHSFEKDIVFICGRYEGVDERFLEKYVDEYFSMGDFILTGGELAVMTIIDSSMRFVPGVLGNKLSAVEESFVSGLLEEPLYTRPREFEGMEIPQAYVSGDHAKIEKFRQLERIRITKKYRPDLLD